MAYRIWCSISGRGGAVGTVDARLMQHHLCRSPLGQQDFCSTIHKSLQPHLKPDTLHLRYLERAIWSTLPMIISFIPIRTELD